MPQRNFPDRYFAGGFIDLDFRNGSSHGVGAIGSCDSSSGDLRSAGSGRGRWAVGPTRLLDGRDEDFGNPFVAGEIFQSELNRVNALTRSDFVHERFAGEHARQIAGGAQVAGSQRPVAFLYPRNVCRQNFLVLESINLSAASGAIQKSRCSRLEANLT